MTNFTLVGTMCVYTRKNEDAWDLVESVPLGVCRSNLAGCEIWAVGNGVQSLYVKPACDAVYGQRVTPRIHHTMAQAREVYHQAVAHEKPVPSDTAERFGSMLWAQLALRPMLEALRDDVFPDAHAIARKVTLTLDANMAVSPLTKAWIFEPRQVVTYTVREA